MSRGPVTLFEEFPDDYDGWLGGSVPELPSFSGHDHTFQAIIINIKSLLFEKILEGCALLLEEYRPHDEVQLDILGLSLRDNQVLWKAVIAGHKYGFNYLCSRVDARNLFADVVARKPAETRAVSQFLSQISRATRAINYGFRQYFADDRMDTTLATKFVPPRAIVSVGREQLVVLKSDTDAISAQKALETKYAIYDLHDLATMVTSTFNQGLYGNKHQHSFRNMKAEHVQLVTSPGLRDLKGPLFSDGILFSEFLTGLWEQHLGLLGSDKETSSYEYLTSLMAAHLAEYLICERRLWHPSTRTLVKNTQQPTPHQLAILAQNKAYEHPASEVEQRVFTRGGPPGDPRDELNELDPLQRIDALAWGNCHRKWMYFEVRHTLKHRAQVEAYCLVARAMIRRGEDREMCERILDNLQYVDAYKTDRRRNMFLAVAEKEWRQMDPKEKWDIVNKKGKKPGEGTVGKGKEKEEGLVEKVNGKSAEGLEKGKDKDEDRGEKGKGKEVISLEKGKEQEGVRRRKRKEKPGVRPLKGKERDVDRFEEVREVEDWALEGDIIEKGKFF